MEKRLLIGIDDTDNAESRGTGFRARQLGALLESEGLATVNSISRHQLFFDRRIPYTSHNSSACIDLQTNELEKVIAICRSFLPEESAPGSDAGLAVRYYDEVNDIICDWGKRAKVEILTQSEARLLARNNGVYLEGFTGTEDGVIGSMAAIGLRKAGDDGRCLWVRGKDLREISGTFTVGELLKLVAVDHITDKTYNRLQDDQSITVGEWMKPIVKDHKLIIIAEQIQNDKNHEWHVATKDYIKSITG
jgi:hypothetical protein